MKSEFFPVEAILRISSIKHHEEQRVFVIH